MLAVGSASGRLINSERSKHLARSGDELVLAWSQGVEGSESGALQVQTAVASLP